MTSSTRHRATSKPELQKEKSDNLKQLTIQASSGASEANTQGQECRILAELERLRKENLDGHTQTRTSLTKLENSMQELKGEMTKLEKRTTEAEGRISDTEDTARRHERALRYLLLREMDLTARYEDLQNRSRRNNLRIYGVPEGSEGGDVKAFMKELIQSALQPMPEVNLQIERAHRALAAKPKNPTATPRSIIVKFVDYSVKEAILKQAWGQRQILYNAGQIDFDHDYSPELQKKRTQVRHVIKQLKQKNIRAKCIYLARLKMVTDGPSRSYRSSASRSGWTSGSRWREI